MSKKSFKCHGCGHECNEDYNLRTEGFCYLCDPNITLEECISENEIEKRYTLSIDDILQITNSFTDIVITKEMIIEELQTIKSKATNSHNKNVHK
jgi:hypothetical protein